jgi:MFS family permease
LTNSAEHARKIGIWAGTFIFSPYAGPFLSGIIVNFRSWRVSSWVNTALLVAVLGDETFYDHEKAAHGHDQTSTDDSKWLTHFKKLVGITGYKAHHHGVGRTVKDLGIMVSRPHFLALCSMYSNVFPVLFSLQLGVVAFIRFGVSSDRHFQFSTC